MTPGANLSIVLATALAAAGLTADLSDRSTIYSSPLVDLPVETLTECGQCLQSGCDPDEHSLNVEADWKPDRTCGESSHGCRPDYCSQAHSGGGCSGFATLDPEERLRLWNAVVQLGDADLAALVRELGEPVSYNAERQALQVRGCDGNVALSIPLSAAQAQRLAEQAHRCCGRAAAGRYLPSDSTSAPRHPIVLSSCCPRPDHPVENRLN